MFCSSFSPVVCLFHAVLKRQKAADFPFDHSSCGSEPSITALQRAERRGGTRRSCSRNSGVWRRKLESPAVLQADIDW